MIKKISLVAISALALAACNDQASTGGAAGGSRQEIRIVGSSTVFPFAKAASEAFAKADPSRKSPVLESTGTGGGIEQFCKGVGAETPDIANASRRMKKSEFENCQKNGVKDIIEVRLALTVWRLHSRTRAPSSNCRPLTSTRRSQPTRSVSHRLQSFGRT